MENVEPPAAGGGGVGGGTGAINGAGMMNVVRKILKGLTSSTNR